MSENEPNATAEADRHIEQDGNVKARALKVNDPEFLLGRLTDDKEALLVTRVTRKSLEKTPFVLVNKKKDDDDPVMAFAVVQFEQEEGTVDDLESLGDRVAGIDEQSRTDFGEGGEKAGDKLYVLKLSLVDKFGEPIELKEPPPGRRFGGEVDLERDRVKEASESFKPPQSVADAAAKGLDLRDKFGRGGTEVGIARGRDLSNQRPVSVETLKRMRAFFDRHEENKDTPPEEGNGMIAWLLWGGDPGRKWAKETLNRVERMKESKEEIILFIDLEDDDLLQEGIRPLFGSPGGKRFLASTIIGFIPEHTKYVEPFVGGGAVFFAKKPSKQEVINDLHKGVIHALRCAQNITEAQIAELRKKPMDFDRKLFFKVRDTQCSDDMGKLHRFLYLNMFSFGKDGKSTMAENFDGRNLSHKINRMDRIRERLEGVTITDKDFREVLQAHDSESTFFYLDPPYPDQQGSLKTSLTNEDIRNSVAGLKGKWILSLPNTESVRKTFADYHRRAVSVRRTTAPEKKSDSEVLIANFPLRTSSAYRFREEHSERIGQEIAPSGLHEHPHPPNGIHSHLGSPPNTGGHAHEQSPGSGAHRHRDGDPIDGFHLGDPTDEGAHVHILANREKVPALWEWYRKVVAAHFPMHQWLDGHAKTWIAELQEDGSFSEPRESAQADWDMHGLWAMHSAGANERQHQAVYLNEETRFVQLFYEFEDGNRREVTAEDFDQEAAWFDEHLPFPREEVTKALGGDGELQESNAPIEFATNYDGAELAFYIHGMVFGPARDLARRLSEANPRMGVSIRAGDETMTFGPQSHDRETESLPLRGLLVGDLFAGSRGLVANLRSMDLREVAPIDQERWAVAIEGGDRHARLLNLPNGSADELKAIVGQMAVSNPDRVFHLAKAVEQDKSAGPVFRIAASMLADR